MVSSSLDFLNCFKRSHLRIAVYGERAYVCLLSHHLVISWQTGPHHLILNDSVAGIQQRDSRIVALLGFCCMRRPNFIKQEHNPSKESAGIPGIPLKWQRIREHRRGVRGFLSPWYPSHYQKLYRNFLPRLHAERYIPQWYESILTFLIYWI